MTFSRAAMSLVVLALAASGCGDSDPPMGPPLSQAQYAGVGAACRSGVNADCVQTPAPLECLPFKGGYCGLRGCTKTEDCPLGSACVAHDDGQNYCFLICVEKVDCNPTRPLDAQSNCSSNITFVGGDRGKKACVPPS
jgi:hypothetical protein